MSSTLVTSLLNSYLCPEVRTAAKGHLKSWMFEKDSWPYKFVQCLEQPHYDNKLPEVKEFIVDLHNTFKVYEGDCEFAAQVILDYAPPSSFERAINNVQEWVKDAYLSAGIEYIAAGGSKDLKRRGVEHIEQGLNLQFATDTFLDFSDVNIVNQARLMDLPADGHVIPSIFSVVNKSLAYKGYKKGDLVMIAAESGVGKSTILCTEAAHFAKLGYRVAHIVLGDMSDYDIFVKYLSNFHNVDSGEIITEGHRQFMTPEVIGYLKNVRVKTLSPDTFDIYQLLAKVNQIYNKFKYDVLVVDYDGNIKESGGSGNSYVEGGTIYANLKGHAQNRCVVFVASQTKITFWGEEIVQKHHANDSSKKQHHVDVMLGLGRNKECPKIGTLNLAKVRRGQTDVRVRVAMENEKGMIREITQQQYQDKLAKFKVQQNELSYDMEDAV